MKRLGAAVGWSLLSSVALPGVCPAQAPHVIAELYGASAYQSLGTSNAIVGDVDGDGHADYLIGVPGATVDGFALAGYATLRSGRDGTEIRRIDGASIEEYRGFVAALGDVDGDGTPDYSVAAPTIPIGDWDRAGTMAVFSGATGALLYQLNGEEPEANYGLRVAGIGDVDGDGKSDIALGVPWHMTGVFGDAGAVMIYSGADGALIRRIEGQRAGGSLGFSLSAIGDVDGDGRADLVAGEPGDGDTIPGAARVLSAWTGVQIYGFQSASTTDSFGFGVAGLGDANGDGVADVAVSAPYASDGTLTECGAVPVFSGATKGVLFTIRGVSDGQHLGASLAAAGDVDFDGRGDLVVGTSVYSGQTATALFQADASGHETLGDAVAGGGDVNGDGGADVIFGAPGDDLTTVNPPGSILRAGYAVVLGYPISDFPVVIDAVPDACPNRLPAPPTDRLDVVLRGRSDLDVAKINPTSIRLNGVPLVAYVSGLSDEAVTKRSGTCDDCGAPATDGFLDLVARFDLAQVAATLVPNEAGLANLDLTAQLYSGRRIRGSECMHVPPARLLATPNPARRGVGVTLTFTNPAGGAPPHIRVYDLRGRLIRDLPLREIPAGPGSVTWNARDSSGAPVAGGLYVARAETGGRILGTARVVIVP